MSRPFSTILAVLIWAGATAPVSATTPAPASPPAASPGAAPASLQDADEITVPPPTVHYTASPEAVPFELFRGTRMFLQGSINGVPTGMMLDTGASSTVLDTAFARQHGIVGDRALAIRAAEGRVPGELASGVTIRVGSMTLRDAGVLIMDLSTVSAAIGRPIPVILGHEAIDAGPVRIDFPGRTMTFIPANGFVAPEGAITLPLGHDGPLRSVKVSVGGAPEIDATFDIGNGSTIVLAQSYWTTRPELANLPRAESMIGGVGGFKRTHRVTLPQVTFAGETLTSVPATLTADSETLPTEGANVGIEMLKPFVVTTDYANDRLYFERAGAWEGFRRERAGVMAQLRGDRLRVHFASVDGPAAAAGLKEGDEIVAIDGHRIGADFYQTPQADWAMAPAGTRVVMTRADGSEVDVTLRDYF